MNTETKTVEAGKIDMNNIIETRNPGNNRMQPLVAARALKNLVNDPEKTDQVFVIIKAMSGNSLEKAYTRFRKQRWVKQSSLRIDTCLKHFSIVRPYEPISREHLLTLIWVS